MVLKCKLNYNYTTLNINVCRVCVYKCSFTPVCVDYNSVMNRCWRKYMSKQVHSESSGIEYHFFSALNTSRMCLRCAGGGVHVPVWWRIWLFWTCWSVLRVWSLWTPLPRSCRASTRYAWHAFSSTRLHTLIRCAVQSAELLFLDQCRSSRPTLCCWDSSRASRIGVRWAHRGTDPSDISAPQSRRTF